MSEIRTSLTHPIRVDFVEHDVMALPGRLGLTFAPGKKQRYAQTGSWDRDLETDLRALRDEFRTDVLVSLIEEHEFERLQIRDLREQAPRFGIEVLWFPIRDQSVPNSLSKFHEVVERITGDLRLGRTVVIHCMGGLGRTGLVATACLLALTQMSPEEAVAVVRKARAGAVETAEQAEYLSKYLKHLVRLRGEGPQVT
jgi:protein-tyrosine phosphatase